MCIKWFETLLKTRDINIQIENIQTTNGVWKLHYHSVNVEEIYADLEKFFPKSNKALVYVSRLKVVVFRVHSFKVIIPANGKVIVVGVHDKQLLKDEFEPWFPQFIGMYEKSPMKKKKLTAEQRYNFIKNHTPCKYWLEKRKMQQFKERRMMGSIGTQRDLLNLHTSCHELSKNTSAVAETSNASNSESMYVTYNDIPLQQETVDDSMSDDDLEDLSLVADFYTAYVNEDEAEKGNTFDDAEDNELDDTYDEDLESPRNQQRRTASTSRQEEGEEYEEEEEREKENSQPAINASTVSNGNTMSVDESSENQLVEDGENLPLDYYLAYKDERIQGEVVDIINQRVEAGGNGVTNSVAEHIASTVISAVALHYNKNYPQKYKQQHIDFSNLLSFYALGLLIPLQRLEPMSEEEYAAMILSEKEKEKDQHFMDVDE